MTYYLFVLEIFNSIIFIEVQQRLTRTLQWWYIPCFREHSSAGVQLRCPALPVIAFLRLHRYGHRPVTRRLPVRSRQCLETSRILYFESTTLQSIDQSFFLDNAKHLCLLIILRKWTVFYLQWLESCLSLYLLSVSPFPWQLIVKD